MFFSILSAHIDPNHMDGDIGTLKEGDELGENSAHAFISHFFAAIAAVSYIVH